MGEPKQVVEEAKKEETKTYYDVVNVSEGFQLRTAYKKKVKPSKLDGLLERRVKQFTLEEKLRLERMKQTALQSKMAATKPSTGVKTEGSTSVKQEPAMTPCVKLEDKEAALQEKDQVVKKLDFDQEEMETKTQTDNQDAKLDSTAPNHSTRTAVNAVQGKDGESTSQKEVNGGLQAGTEINNRNNCISEAIESKEKPQRPEVARAGENARKRGYEEIEQGSGVKDVEADVDQSKTSQLQVNGKAAVTASEDSNSNSDLASRVQGDISDGPQKEPVKALMNGSLTQNDMSNVDHPPPSKIPKLENHVAEKDDSTALATSKNQEVSMDSKEGININNKDNCSNSGGLKPTTQGTITPTATTESQTVHTADVTSSKPAVVTGSVSSTTIQPSSLTPGAVASQKSKTVTSEFADTKTGISGATVTSSMTISKEYSTRDRISLLRFSKSKKARSGTALPSYRKFVTKSSKKSIFVLPNDDLKKLARRAGIREVPIFNYNAKPALDIWPYPSPRPTFGITWRFVTNVLLLLHYLRCLKHTFNGFHFNRCPS